MKDIIVICIIMLLFAGILIYNFHVDIKYGKCIQKRKERIELLEEIIDYSSRNDSFSYDPWIVLAE